MSACPAAQGPDPVWLMHPAIPAGCEIAPMVVFRFKRATELPAAEETYTLFPSAVGATQTAPTSPCPSPHGPAPVSLMQPAVPAGWGVAPGGGFGGEGK